MKHVGKTLLIILSTILRTLPILIFVLTHIGWEIYTYTLDPLELLDPMSIPSILGNYSWLYLSLGVIILVFLTMDFKLLAYSTFFGAWGGQNLYFLRQWDNLIYDMKLPSLQGTWYSLIFIGLLIGFLLQVLYTGGRKYYKVKQYNHLKQQRKKLKKA
ncbi:hypothetical protein NQU17_07980 [Clostridiaceae bacterium HFYG-1003]|nr:hypothetical protein NQU17_07980 [Clostridiaceae bacterium HFYG-1003]